MQEIEKLAETLHLANHAYHLGRPMMTDLEYDLVWQQLRELSPEHPALFPNKSMTQTGEVVQHTRPCLSLNKAMKGEELLPFLVRFKGQVISMEPKYDGVFLRAYQFQDHMVYTLSGDGLLGRDITQLFRPFQLKLEPGDYEVIIPNERWDKSLGSNPRNTVAGLLNSKRLSLEEFRLLSFIPHNKAPHKEEHVINNFEVPLWEQRCFTYYLKLKEKYPLDGIVLKVIDPEIRQVAGANQDFPHWAIAWKPPIQIAQTTVTNVSWRTNRTQRVTPTVHFNPTVLCDTINSKATGNNASWIRDRGIGPGAIITVGKAGEIIPQILSVPRRVSVSLPRECPICGAELTQRGLDLICPSFQCLSALIARMEFFYSNSGLPLKGIGRAFFEEVLQEEMLRQAFIDRPWLLYLMNPLHLYYESFVEIVGQEAMLKIISSAQATISSELYNHAHFIAALGLPGIGWKSAMAWLLSMTDQAFRRSTKISNTQKTIEANLSLVILGLQELSWLLPVSGDFSKAFSLTGTFSIPRNEIILMMQKLNWMYDEPVVTTTNYLFCSRDSFGSSQKWKDATRWGIQIKGERELLEILSPLIKTKTFNDFIPGQ